MPGLDRRQLLLFAPAAVLAAGLAGAGAYLWLGEPEERVAIGGSFSLIDGTGKTITDQSFRGRWMLVYFGYTHCPDACPTALQDMANAMDLLGSARKDVALLFITIDPERDTPAVMQDYVSAFNAGIVPLSGSPAAVAQAAKAYRVYYAKHPDEHGGYDMDHSSIIYVMDPRGRFVTNFTQESAPAQIASKLRDLNV